jgi:hypothetical protein
MAVGPLQSFTAAAERVGDLAMTRDQLQAAVDRLEDRRALLHDPDELELLARQDFGLVRPGEIPFVVVTPDDEFSGAGPDEVTGSPVSDARPWYRRLWRAFMGLFSDAPEQ